MMKSFVLKSRLKTIKYSKAFSNPSPHFCPAGDGSCAKAQIKEFYCSDFFALLREYVASSGGIYI
jgi:hypothetical protein